MRLIMLIAAIASGSAALAEPTAALPKSAVQSWPGITAHPLEPRDLIGDPTQWYGVQTTAEPDDSLLIGLRNFTQDNGDVDTYKWNSSGMEACSSTKRGSLCVTYSIFDDLDATTFTPFLGCGDRGATNLELARTWTGSGVTETTRPSGLSSDTSTTTDSSGGQSSSTGNAQPTETNAGCKQGPTAYLKIWIGLLSACALFG